MRRWRLRVRPFPPQTWKRKTTFRCPPPRRRHRPTARRPRHRAAFRCAVRASAAAPAEGRVVLAPRAECPRSRRSASWKSTPTSGRAATRFRRNRPHRPVPPDPRRSAAIETAAAVVVVAEGEIVAGLRTVSVASAVSGGDAGGAAVAAVVVADPGALSPIKPRRPTTPHGPSRRRLRSVWNLRRLRSLHQQPPDCRRASLESPSGRRSNAG